MGSEKVMLNSAVPEATSTASMTGSLAMICGISVSTKNTATESKGTMVLFLPSTSPRTATAAVPEGVSAAMANSPLQL